MNQEVLASQEIVNQDVINSILANIDIKTVVLIVGLILVVFFISSVIKSIKRKVRSVKNSIRRTTRSFSANVNDVKKIINTIEQVTEGMQDIVEVKSVGGSTNLYLEKIHKDFPDFHNSDAEIAIKTFLNEYLNIKSGKSTNFSKARVSDKAYFDLSKSINGNVSNIKFNNITIFSYTKTRNDATIKYRVSIGYDVNGKRVETRYEIDYSLQLKDENTGSMAMLCPNCGGAYEAHDTFCPYCGARIVQDTIMNWVISNAKEY